MLNCISCGQQITEHMLSKCVILATIESKMKPTKTMTEVICDDCLTNKKVQLLINVSFDTIKKLDIN